jgi:hypothetical protein
MNMIEKINNNKKYNPFYVSKRGLSLILRKDKEPVSLPKSFVLSTLLHPVIAAVFMLLAVQTVSQLIEKPKPKIKDIEFVLVNSDKTPEKVKPYKIKTNSSKNKITSIPDALKGKSQSRTVFQFSDKHHKGYPSKNHISDEFIIPVSKIQPTSSDIGFGSDGPVGYSSSDASSVSAISNGSGEGGKGRKRGGGILLSDGDAGAPHVGRSSNDFNAVLKDPDMNPYISNLQRKIKRHWTPPKGDENKRVVLFLRIAKGGNLLVLNVKDTSSNPDTDNAAISAVKKTLPFKPLPAAFKENYLDVVFTFDYNVLGSKY